MRKIQPSERHKQALNELLEGGVTQQQSSGSEFLGALIQCAIQRFVTEALEPAMKKAGLPITLDAVIISMTV